MNELELEGPVTDGQRRQQAKLRRERWAVLGVVLLLLGAVAVPQAFRPHEGKQPYVSAHDGPPLKPTAAGEFRGMSLQLHSYDPDIPFEKYIEEIAQSGANTVFLSLAAYQENAASSSIFIEQRKAPSPQRLEKLIELAHSLKMRVVLMPIVLLENAAESEWRGKIKPREPDKWWEDYENIILFYAKIAEKTRTEVFVVGSELISLTNEVERWRRLIRKVRKVYPSGRLTYSDNWDNYFNVTWWNDLDIIGMTSYYDLVGENKPTLEVLINSWKPIKEEILAWQKKFDRPILFTEVGWPNQEGCAKYPWNYYHNPDKPDPETQANCFRAFFQTWAKEPAVAGVLIWEWRNNEGQSGGPKDTSYFPGGKPAMQVIREYYSSPGAPAPPTTTPARQPATAPAGGR